MISVVTVNFNSGNLISRTLNSIKSQTYNFFEYIVIDGGSSDSSLSLLIKNEDIIDTLVIERDNGIYDAMNKGFAQSNYPWIIFLNSGDTFYNETVLEEVSKHLRILSKKKEFEQIGCLYGSTNIISEIDEKIQIPKSLNKRNLILYGTRVLCHQSVFYNKIVFGEFNINYRLKGELDSYYSIIQNNYIGIQIPLIVSNFYTGGVNNQQYLKNAKETIAVNWKYAKILSILGLPSILLRIFRNLPLTWK